MNFKLLLSSLVMLSMSTAAAGQNDLRFHTVQVLQAETTTNHSGALRIEPTYLSNISSGEWFSITPQDLGNGVDTIIMRYAKGDESEISLEIRRESLTGPIVASGNVPSSGGWDVFHDEVFLVDGLKGSQKLFFKFTGDGTIGKIDVLNFGRSQKNVLQAEDSFQSLGVFKSTSNVRQIDSGDWLQFKDVNFGDSFKQISLRYGKSDTRPSRVNFHLDDIDGPIFKRVLLPFAGNREKIIIRVLPEITGTHDIYARFSSPGSLTFLDYISLEEQPSQTQLKLSEVDNSVGMRYNAENNYMRLSPTNTHWIRFDQTSVSYNPEIKLRYARDSDLPMQLEIRRNGPNGRLLGTIDLPDTGGLLNYKTVSTHLIDTPQGIYDLVFRLEGEDDVRIDDIDLIRITQPEKPPLGEQALSNVIIDQFGYLPEMEKIALFRDGEIGLGENDEDYIPGEDISLVDATTHEVVFTGTSEAFQNGAIDPLSGDRIWSFDFSSYEIPGTFYVYDEQNNARSADFEIRENIYENVLREAFRTFVYQRSGFEKTAEIVGENYVDGASHIGPLQDSGARLFNDRRRRSTTRDLSGGWYDAGDFNKYSNWTADYILGLLHAYHANPEAWADNWNLPDSGNGIPDILDEVRWGVEHLQRMQETASETNEANVGAVLSVLESDDNISRPSENLQDSFYGTPSSSATFNAAGAFAYAASTFANLPDQSFQDLAESLSGSAILAYDWAERNPNVKFNNAENGVGAGNSEVQDDYFLDAKRRIGAIYLYGLTQEQKYKNFVETDYQNTRLIKLLWASPYESEEQTALLHYAALPGINSAIGSEINDRFNNIMDFAGNGRPALEESAYKSYVQEYVWGSNRFVSRKGGMFAQLVTYDLSDLPEQENMDVAAAYLHYIHGLNPLGKVYLTNMNNFGAEQSMDEFYHVWFNDGTEWDNVNTSFGPPPGFLVGGPNQFYSGSLDINQPPMKSFVETNTTQNGERSWQLTENSNGYQIEYLRLLSQFVK